MRFGFFGRRIPLAAVVWVAVAISLAVWTQIPSYVVGWDLRIYRNAIDSLRAGHDPYLDGMAVQRVFHAHLAMHGNESPPYTYVYSPITLPFLRGVAQWPSSLSDLVYWIVYGASALITICVGLSAAEGKQRGLFRVLAPLSMFFPGLLHQDTILSGNVAFILYGCAFGAAWWGWRKGSWSPFYVAVVVASCFKAPLLSLLAIPLFSARRRQWVPAGVAAIVGIALFAVQPRIWPAAFAHFLQAVELQFSYNRDFSSSPAGVAANLLYSFVPYQITSLCVYMAYALPVCWVLWKLGLGFLDGHLRLTQWMPVLFLGTILLNPRIMEYDLAPVALPMGLIVWRWFRRRNGGRHTMLRAGLFFVAVNVLASFAWKPTESGLLLGIFIAGCVDLFTDVRGGRRREEASGSTVFEPSLMASAGAL